MDIRRIIREEGEEDICVEEMEEEKRRRVTEQWKLQLMEAAGYEPCSGENACPP